MEEASFQSHVNELRNRLKHSIIVLVVLTCLSFYFASDVVSWIQKDLNVSLHALTAYEALYTQILIALIFGFFFALPAILYQLLKFVKPGLEHKEYVLLRNYLPFAIMLFLVGAVFSYNFIVKASLAFFSSTTSGAGVEAVWGLQNTIGFALKLSAFSGVMFQLPIASLVLSKAGVINPKLMREKRGYFFILVLLASAVATPPDIVSQIILTAPVILLYQFSIYLVDRTE
jgi:sec-independent protein translocase protein TatC